MDTHDILVITKLGEKNTYGKLGIFISTKKAGCHKLLIDYQPSDATAPMLVVVNAEGKDYPVEIIKDSWIVAGGELTHRVYGYTPYGEPDENNNRKTRRERIGSIFSSQSNERIYMLKIHQWPRHPDTDIMAFETSIDERFEKAAAKPAASETE